MLVAPSSAKTPCATRSASSSPNTIGRAWSLLHVLHKALDQLWTWHALHRVPWIAPCAACSVQGARSGPHTTCIIWGWDWSGDPQAGSYDSMSRIQPLGSYRVNPFDIPNLQYFYIWSSAFCSFIICHMDSMKRTYSRELGRKLYLFIYLYISSPPHTVCTTVF